MSGNLDLVRSILASGERGDFSSTDWADPEIEFSVRDGPAPGTWTGVAGMVEGYRHVMNAWDDYRIEAQDYRALGDNRVLVLIRLGGRAKASGLELGQLHPHTAGVFKVREGKISAIALYWSRERALADLGLEE